jgi:hypothetical protein
MAQGAGRAAKMADRFTAARRVRAKHGMSWNILLKLPSMMPRFQREDDAAPSARAMS